ncbi:MAG: LysR family transcriptional regulator [Elusimicrobiota bacterium]
MTFEQISCFIKLLECGGSFTDTARALNTSQPTVSRVMRQLQDSLGDDVPLFETAGRRKKLTPYGQLLGRELLSLREKWEEIPKRLREEAGSAVVEPVALGAGQTAAKYLLPELIRDFKKDNPAVAITLRVELWEDTLKGLRSGELDFALRSVEDDLPQDLKFRPTHDYEHVIIAPKNHPIGRAKQINLEALAPYPFIAPGKTTRGWRALDAAFGREGLDCTLGMTVGGWDLVKLYVECGLGMIALVPEMCIEPRDRRKLIIRHTDHPYLRGRYGIVTKKGRFLSRSARQLIRMIDPAQKQRELKLK